MTNAQTVKVTGINEKTTAIYDENRNLLSTKHKREDDNLRERVDRTYTEDGDLSTSKYRIDREGNGTIDSRWKTKNIYDTDGNLVASVDERDDDGNGTIDTLEQLELTYDGEGNLLTSTNFRSFSDGFEQRVQTAYIYTDDSSLKLTEHPQCIRDSLFRGLGVAIVNYYSVPNASCLWTSLVNKEITKLDSNNDGTIENVSRTVHFYDETGRLKKSVIKQDYGFAEEPDGKADSVERKTYTYSEAGYLLKSISKVDERANGTIDIITKDLYTYNTRDRITNFQSDYSVRGSLEQRTRRKYTYGNRNQLSRYVETIDFGGDGAIDTKTDEQYDYLSQEEGLALALKESEKQVTSPNTSQATSFQRSTEKRKFRGNTYIVQKADESGITINGDEGNDWIETLGGINKVNTGDGNNVVLAGATFFRIGGFSPYEGDFVFWSRVSDAQKNRVTCGSGNDYVASGSQISITDLGEGNNIYDSVGSVGKDTVYSGAGDDLILSYQFVSATAKAFDDQIFAGDGDNTIVAGIGNDEIVAGSGDDIISSGTGKDFIKAGDGKNVVIAGTTGAGNSQIKAGSGNDFIFVDALRGQTKINAGDGKNTIAVRASDGVIICGSDDDEIIAGGGDDVVRTGDGNNIVNLRSKSIIPPFIPPFSSIGDAISGGGKDSVILGKGEDLIILGEGTGDATIRNYQRKDALDVKGIIGITLVQDGENVLVQSEQDVLIATLTGAKIDNVTLIS